jgi:hypothetical protein
MEALMNFRLLTLGIALSLMLLTSQSSYAFELSGAWATNASACKKVFGISSSGAPFLKGDSDLFGGGFIIRGNEIVGKIAKCSILKKRQDKDVVYLMAACSTDVALANVQFAFKINGDNKITRVYPGMDDLNIDYVRCASK